MDVLTPEQRHITMSRIHGRETKPEVLVRKYLFSRGLRYRKNDGSLPGHPDIVLPKYHAVVFVNGCFWHGHQGCKYYRLPKTNMEFWENKITKNQERDRNETSKLESLGWRVISIWECEVKRTKEREERLKELYDSIVAQKPN